MNTYIAIKYNGSVEEYTKIRGALKDKDMKIFNDREFKECMNFKALYDYLKTTEKLSPWIIFKALRAGEEVKMEDILMIFVPCAA